MLVFDLIECSSFLLFFFFFNDTATTEIYTLSLHDALPICRMGVLGGISSDLCLSGRPWCRSEEHTSELQSRFDLVCRLLLETKKELLILFQFVNKNVQNIKQKIRTVTQ